MPVSFQRTLFVDGEPARFWSADILPRYDHDKSRTSVTGLLTDANGHFTATFPSGSYDIVLKGTLPKGERITVLRELTLSADLLTWKCEIKTAIAEFDLEKSLKMARVVRGDLYNGGRQTTDLGPLSRELNRVRVPVRDSILQSRHDAKWVFVTKVVGK